MQGTDWNQQYVQHVDAKARAEIIKQTVYEALNKQCTSSNCGSSNEYDRGHINANRLQT